MATDEQAETLEQTVRLEAIGAAMRFEGPDEESQEERWKLAVRPLVEIIADLRSAAGRANEDGNREIEKLNREIAFLRADLTATRDSGQAYADRIPELEKAYERAATNGNREILRLNGVLANLREIITRAGAAQTAGRDQASEIERLRAKLTDADATIESADLVSAHGQHMRDKTDLAEARTTIDVLAGRLAARGQS